MNGAFYEVCGIGEILHVTDTLTGIVIECAVEVLFRHTCVAHAIVYNRAQGCTCRDKKVILHDLASPWFRRAHLYVGLSRVTRGADIRVA